MPDPTPQGPGHPPPKPPEAPWHVAVDFDGVLFDQAAHVQALFKKIHGVDLGPVHEWPWDLYTHPPVQEAGLTNEETWHIFHTIHTDPTLHEAPPLDAHARTVLATLLEDGHRVDIVTARNHESEHTTRDFLQRHQIPHDHLTMDAHDKTGYDILIDDLPQHVQPAARNGTLALLMDQPYNRAYETDGNPYRVDGWAHIGRIFDTDA